MFTEWIAIREHIRGSPRELSLSWWGQTNWDSTKKVRGYYPLLTTLQELQMEFNQKELEHLLNCLNFYYSESDHKEFIMEINSQLCKKIDDQLVLHRRAF